MQVQAGKPDIILLDIMMPVLDGLEVCKQVRKISDVLIIMLTAKDSDDDCILGLKLVRTITSPKPFNTRGGGSGQGFVLGGVPASHLQPQQAGPGASQPGMINLSGNIECCFRSGNTFTAKEMELLWCPGLNPRHRVLPEPAPGKDLGLHLLWRYPVP